MKTQKTESRNGGLMTREGISHTHPKYHSASKSLLSLL